MRQILRKELSQFLSSLIAYVVIGVFLTGIGLLMWVFPDTSVLVYGFADMETLFSLGPFVFMFLIPAITMRMLAEEKKTGTLETLLTSPLTEWQIVLGKYFAAWILVVFAVLPTLIYFYSVYQLGNPVGNLDIPGITGSYIGLILLGGVFTTFGLAASAYTDNQIIAFMLAIFLCFFMYTGLSSIAGLFPANLAIYIEDLSISYHYDALSRGLIDTRDITYFVSVIIFVLILTHWKLVARKLSYKPIRSRLFKRVTLGVLALLVFNLIATVFFFRFDLTEDQRYTLQPATKDMLRQVDQPLTIEILIDGDIPAGFERLKRSIVETIEEFNVYTQNEIDYFFTDPSGVESPEARTENFQYLMSQGFEPTRVFDNEDGKQTQKVIFPYVIIRYDQQAAGVRMLKGSQVSSAQQQLNQSIEGIEFELAVAIQRLAKIERKRIALVTGHQELDSLDIAGFLGEMIQFFDIDQVRLEDPRILQNYDALVIGKPLKPFSNGEKYALDQYIMHGGNVIFLINALVADMAEAGGMGTIARTVDHDLDDLLFRYGIRLNDDFIQDIQNFGRYPVVLDGADNVINLPWPFYASINQFTKHPVTKNLDAVYGRFFGTIDTVKAEGITKTPLMQTSPYTKVFASPARVAFEDYANQPDVALYNHGVETIGYLLEGNFTSLFKNRILADSIDQTYFLDKGLPSKLIVVSDGDLMRNERNLQTGGPYELGFNPFADQGEKLKYANRDFLFNALAYMTDENGLITSRNKEIILRPLDRVKLQNSSTQWQLFNMITPLVLLILFGVVRATIRKRKFAN
jgi:ABC-2 type transport system permease protein